MQASCLQENLKQALIQVGRTVPGRATLPILSHVLLRTDGGRLALTTADLEVATTQHIGARVDQDGAIALPAKMLRELVAAMPQERIDLIVEKMEASLTCGSRTLKLKGQDATEFPPVPTVEGPAVTVDVARAVCDVVHCVASAPDRPVLTGILLELRDGKLTLTGADGFRLGVAAVPCDGEMPDTIIPVRAFLEAARLDGPIEIRCSEKATTFSTQDVTITAQNIIGTFPDYRQLIPKDSTTTATFQVDGMLREVKAASLIVKDNSRIVRLVVGGDSIQVIARAEEIGEHSSTVEAQVRGEAAKIAFNGVYLSDMLSHLKTGLVSMDVTSPSSPGLFRVDGRDTLYVVMPHFVQW